NGRGGEDVDPAVVVVVAGPAGEAAGRTVDAHLLRDVRESAVAVVAEQPGRPGGLAQQGRDADVQEQVGVAVVVEVEPRCPQDVAHDVGGQAGPGRHLLER